MTVFSFMAGSCPERGLPSSIGGQTWNPDLKFINIPWITVLSKYISTVKYLCNIIITGHLHSLEKWAWLWVEVEVVRLRRERGSAYYLPANPTMGAPPHTWCQHWGATWGMLGFSVMPCPGGRNSVSMASSQKTHLCCYKYKTVTAHHRELKHILSRNSSLLLLRRNSI